MSTTTQAYQFQDYIVNNAGDTLMGQIMDNSWFELGKKIEFTDEKGVSSEYLPKDIKAFKIGEYEFESMDHQKFSMFFMTSFEKKSFMLNLNNGKAKLYMRFPTPTSYTASEGLGVFSESSEYESMDYFLVYPEGEVFRIFDQKAIENGNQIFITDCPECSNKNYESYPPLIEAMVDNYNQNLDQAEQPDYSGIYNSPNEVNIYIFLKTPEDETLSKNLTLRIDGKKLPNLTQGEYLTISQLNVYNYYLKVKGKNFKAAQFIFSRKNHPILLEVDLDDWSEHFRIITPEEAKEKYIDTQKAIIFKK